MAEVFLQEQSRDDESGELSGAVLASGDVPHAAERHHYAAPADRQRAHADLLSSTRDLAEELASRPNLGLQAAPRRELERCAEIGLMTAPLPLSEGGLGLGSEPGTQLTLMRLLAAVGGMDLAVGRIFEGHVNGLLLVNRYGTREQVSRLAEDVHAGMLSGVWNTGRPEPMRLLAQEDGHYLFQGGKTFATGAAFVRRPIVTADLPGRGWQMTIPQMESIGVPIDRSFWHPLGMESSESYGIDFSGGRVNADALIGQPGEFYRDPMFRGGAIRFAAVQAGAVLRLHSMFADWLDRMNRGDDPYQVVRLGEVAIAAQEAAMWVEKAASIAEQNFYRSEKVHSDRMIEGANMMRSAIERLGTAVMQKVIAGVGAHGLLQPERFERVIRDLTMYLRQPAPDATLAAIGRYSIEKSHRRAAGGADGFWSDGPGEESLPVKYFDRIYSRQRDPWSFESSDYEREKYASTLGAIPDRHYESALEVGCSIGVLTEKLAPRADAVLALDVSDRALEIARTRCSTLPGVQFEKVRVPDEMPDGSFDLIVVSEVAYYWTRADLERAATEISARHLPGGHLVLVHLTEWVPDYPLTGDAVHDYWLSRPDWKRVSGERKARYRLDVLERLPVTPARPA